jgi:serine/threonine-protein kinase
MTFLGHSDLARYDVGELLGRGGMGEVLLAHDPEIGRDVALKRMRAADPDDEAVERFLREAKIQARLDHPAIVPVHELGHDAEGRPYFTMKRLTGVTLASVLEKGGATPQRLLRASSRTRATSSTATSSRRTSCSATTARSTCSTGASRT